MVTIYLACGVWALHERPGLHVHCALHVCVVPCVWCLLVMVHVYCALHVCVVPCVWCLLVMPHAQAVRVLPCMCGAYVVPCWFPECVCCAVLCMCVWRPVCVWCPVCGALMCWQWCVVPHACYMAGIWKCEDGAE